MFVDCDSCPGAHLAPPACPTCVVRVLLDQPPPATVVGAAGPAGDTAGHPVGNAAGPVPVPVLGDLVLAPDTDDLGAPLDPAERRAVAVLAARGLLPGTAGVGSRHAVAVAGGHRRRPRTA